MPQKAKFQIEDLLGIAMVFVVLGLLLTYSGDIQQDVYDDQFAVDNNSFSTNISKDALENTNTFSDKSGTIVKVVIAAIIIGILLTYFLVRMK